MRNLITAMKISVDGKFEGPQGYADWVADWSDDYGLTPQIDACVLGGRMYPGYEQYWTPIQDEPDQVHPQTGAVPTPAEVEWGRFAKPHSALRGVADPDLPRPRGRARGSCAGWTTWRRSSRNPAGTST